MKFRNLILRYAFPISVICFTIFNKWWYANVPDTPDTLMFGFPLISVSEGWHTSSSIQVFLLEYLINYCFFFGIVSGIILLWNRFLKKIRLNKIWSITLLIVASIIVLMNLYVASMTENIIKFKRDFEIEVIDSGYKFIWQTIDRDHLILENKT